MGTAVVPYEKEFLPVHKKEWVKLSYRTVREVLGRYVREHAGRDAYTDSISFADDQFVTVPVKPVEAK